MHSEKSKKSTPSSIIASSLHGLKRHRLDEPRGNVEKKKFDLELILNEAHARHRAALPVRYFPLL